MPSMRPIDRFVASRVGRGIAGRIRDYFDARLEEAERIPKEGPALVVGNHSVFGLDAFVLGALFAERGRMPYWLGDRILFRFAPGRRAMEAVGCVEGAHHMAVRLLGEGHLVVVYPGGILDSAKGTEERHKLQWRDRTGFARVALEARAPIVPVAVLGMDDALSIVAHEPVLGRAIFGDPRYDFPIVVGRWGLPLPRRVPVTAHALEAVEPQGDAGREEDVWRLRERVRERLQGRLDRG
jgi:1-acyl-sn-glycerol-3-phosphate acyltransferase